MNHDRNLVLLHLTKDSIDVSRLDNYMYVYQRLGMKLGYKFRLGVNGVKSKVFNKYLEDKLSDGIIVQNKRVISITHTGLKVYDSYLVTKYELTVLEVIKAALDRLTSEELDLLLVTDLLITDTKVSYGIQGLVDNRSSIEKMAEQLCSAYSPQNFNRMVKFILDLEKLLL